MNEVYHELAQDNRAQKRGWYVTQIKPNCAKIAERNLARVGCAVFAPYEEVTLRRGSQFQLSPRPLFPGYLFTSFDPATVAWRSVNSTYGVTRLVSFATDHPSRVPDHLVLGLMERCDPDGRLLSAPAIAQGDEVVITSGPFADFVGTVETLAPQQRVWVLLEMMGARRQVEIHAGQARIASPTIRPARAIN